MRRIFIIRKDLNLSRGKMCAMVGHCCEAYWTQLLHRYNDANTTVIMRPPYGQIPGYMTITVDVPSDIWFNYILGIFTKTICEAKNLNDLLKIKDLIKQYNDKILAEASLNKNIERVDELIEDRDYGFINDKCLTELKPENEDGTTTVGVWFRPLPDDLAHFFSKKYKLFDAFHKKRNCDVYKTYEEARCAYIESHNVTDKNSDMMKWLFEEYKKCVEK